MELFMELQIKLLKNSLKIIPENFLEELVNLLKKTVKDCWKSFARERFFKNTLEKEQSKAGKVISKKLFPDYWEKHLL